MKKIIRKKAKQKQHVNYWFSKGHKYYGDILKLIFPNHSRIYFTTKQGLIVTLPKRLCREQLENKKIKHVQIGISPIELEALYKAMQKTIFKNNGRKHGRPK